MGKGAMRAVRIIGLVAASALAMTNCTTMHGVAAVAGTSQPSSWRVSPGDKLRVTMRDGRRTQFTVRAVDPGAIVAHDGATYDLADILTVERRAFSGAKTGLLVVGIVGGALLVVVAAAEASLAGGI